MFICAMSEVERVKVEGQVDVFQTIKGMRIQRPHMVDTPVSVYWVAVYLDCVCNVIICHGVYKCVYYTHSYTKVCNLRVNTDIHM